MVAVGFLVTRRHTRIDDNGRSIFLSNILSDVAQHSRDNSSRAKEYNFSERQTKYYTHTLACISIGSFAKHGRSRRQRQIVCAVLKTNNSSMSNTHLFLFGAHAPSTCSIYAVRSILRTTKTTAATAMAMDLESLFETE